MIDTESSKNPSIRASFAPHLTSSPSPAPGPISGANGTPTLAISFLCYNDADSLRELLCTTAQIAATLTNDFVLLAINDGSTDDTGAVLEELQRELPRLEVVHHPKNEGFGPTIREAFLRPRAEWVTFLPGDAQIPPNALNVMFAATKTHDAIIGLRARRQDSFRRRLASGVYNRLLSLVAGRRLRDTNSILLVRQALLDPEAIHGRSAFVHAEILLSALRQGARYTEVPIPHAPRRFGTGAGNRLSVILPTFRDLIRYGFENAVRRIGGNIF